MNGFKVSAILSSIVVIIGLVGMVLLGTVQSYVQLFCGLLWLIITLIRIKKAVPLKGKLSDYLAGRILVFILLLGFGVIFVSPIRLGNRFQYPFQMAYINNHGYDNEFFPESLPEKTENYTWDFMPSIMQGSGWTNVSFRTDAATLEQYVGMVEEGGCKVESLENHKALELVRTHLPKDIQGNLQGSLIYIIRFKDDWNHPRLSCMIVNKSTGDVMFFEM